MFDDVALYYYFDVFWFDDVELYVYFDYDNMLVVF
jgi:hypothetical protein